MSLSQLLAAYLCFCLLLFNQFVFLFLTSTFCSCKSRFLCGCWTPETIRKPHPTIRFSLAVVIITNVFINCVLLRSRLVEAWKEWSSSYLSVSAWSEWTKGQLYKVLWVLWGTAHIFQLVKTLNVLVVFPCRSVLGMNTDKEDTLHTIDIMMIDNDQGFFGGLRPSSGTLIYECPNSQVFPTYEPSLEYLLCWEPKFEWVSVGTSFTTFRPQLVHMVTLQLVGFFFQ